MSGVLVRNLTPFPFGRLVTSRRPPRPAMSIVVRGRYDVVPGGVCRVSEGDDPLVQGILRGETLAEAEDPALAAPLAPNDLVPFKLAAEVLVVGSCHAPGGRPVTELPVSVRVGAWSKGIVAVGRRAYSDGLGGAHVGPPQPFVSMPLDMRHAFGGPGDPDNPAGRGLSSAEAPNLEHPGERLGARGSRPARGPASLGAINARWPSRASLLGTAYGGAWRKERFPHPAEDFDWRHHHEAPADQRLGGYLRGDEPISLVNLHPTLPKVESRLPGERARVFIQLSSGEVREIPLGLDTLVVLSDVGRVELSWRGLTEVDAEDLEDVTAIVIGLEPIGAPRPDVFYERELERAKEGVVPALPPELAARREEALAQLAAARAASEAAKRADVAPSDAITDQIVAALPASDPRAADVRSQVRAALSEMEAHVPADKAARDPIGKYVPDDVPPAPPPRRPPTPGVAPPLSPNRALAKGIDDAIAEARKARAELEADPQGKAGPQADDLLSRLEALKADPRFVPVFRPRVEPGPGRDLADQDLAGEDLRGADLRGANLDGAILARADLSGAKLAGARLAHAVLFQARLDDADLSEADLTLANLTEALGARTRLRGALIDRTFFERASLERADLSGARAVAGLFEQARLGGASFEGAHLERCLFEGTVLDGASFRGARLRRVSFSAASLAGATFERAELVQSGLVRCRAERASFLRARGEAVSLQESSLDEADLSRVVFPGLLFPKASLRGARLFGADLRGCKGPRAVLDGASFEQANLADADLRRVSCHATSFRDAMLFGAVLLGAAGKGAQLGGAHLTRCQIEGLG